jgi:hypothetical protein
MTLTKLCSPALIYLVFSITQITIDTIKGMYNTALIKIVVTFSFTILLNYLCQLGLGIVSWIIVFIPFILMTVIVSILLLMFGLDPMTGNLKIYDNGKKPKNNLLHKKTIVDVREKNKLKDLEDKTTKSLNKLSDEINKLPMGKKKNNINISEYNNDGGTIDNRKIVIDIYNVLRQMNEENEGAYFLNRGDSCSNINNKTKSKECIKKLVNDTIAKLGPVKGVKFKKAVKGVYPNFI